jgi:hypothetical protein
MVRVDNDGLQDSKRSLRNNHGSGAQEELHRAVAETSARLRQRGVALTGRETSDELVTLLESVERFELV